MAQLGRWSVVALLALLAGAGALYLGMEDPRAPKSMALQDSIPALDAALEPWHAALGEERAGYTGHCYRVYHFALALATAAGLELDAAHRELLAIAVAHHDLGIWSDRLADGHPNIDYLEPSARRAEAYLKEHNKPASWQRPVRLLITEHHKMRKFKRADADDAAAAAETTHKHDDDAEFSETDAELVEVMRRADLADFSLGVARSGLPRSLVEQVRSHFPNAGFHAFLVRLVAHRLASNPLNPLPMMKL